MNISYRLDGIKVDSLGNFKVCRGVIIVRYYGKREAQEEVSVMTNLMVLKLLQITVVTSYRFNNYLHFV